MVHILLFKFRLKSMEYFINRIKVKKFTPQSKGFK